MMNDEGKMMNAPVPERGLRKETNPQSRISKPQSQIADSPSLILHADDFGMNPAVTEGVLDGFRRGLLTSVSILSNAPDAARAAGLWKQLLADHAAGSLPSQPIRRELADPPAPFDLGVHLNLTQGAPLTANYPAELRDPSGRFPGVFALFRRLWRRPERYAGAIREELGRQIGFLRDQGVQPTHLNGHQYIEWLPAVADVLPGLLERYGIGVIRMAEEPGLWRSTLLKDFSLPRWLLACVKRHFARRFRGRIARLSAAHPEVFFGTAHAGRINLPLLRLFLSESRSSQTIEIGLHPGRAVEGIPVDATTGWHDPLASQRPRELQMLTSPELAAHLQQRHLSLGRLNVLRKDK
jgi:chitin disaccharide deacetylase